MTDGNSSYISQQNHVDNMVNKKAPTSHLEFQERLEKALMKEFGNDEGFDGIFNQHSTFKTSWWCDTYINYSPGKQFNMEIHVFPDDVENHPGRFTKSASWVAELDPEGAKEALKKSCQ